MQKFSTVLKEALPQEVEHGVVLSDIFTKKPNACTVKREFNALMKEEPKYTYTILGLILYPALNWSLYGKDIVNVIKDTSDDSAVKLWSETQEMLRSCFGCDKPLRLQSRENYFEEAAEIVHLIESASEKVRTYPRTGTQMFHLMHLVMDVSEDDGSEMSRFEAKKYAIPTIRLLHQTIGKELKNHVQRLLLPALEIAEENDGETCYVYHNVKILLKEYAHLMWDKGDSASDIVGKVLRCETPSEVMKISKRLDVIYSADTVLQFLLLVSGCIAMLEYYPLNGSQYAAVIKSLVMNRNIQRKDGTYGYASERELAQMINICPSKFSTLKQEAFALLGLLLWGYDGQLLRKALSDNSSATIVLDK